MSAALKLASLASGLTLVGYSTMHMVQTPQKEFSQNSLALDHTLETPAPQAARPKLYVSHL